MIVRLKTLYFQLYGGSVAGQILTCFGRLFISFLQSTRGFSLGVQDILVTKKVSIYKYSLIVFYGKCNQEKILIVEKGEKSTMQRSMCLSD